MDDADPPARVPAPLRPVQGIRPPQPPDFAAISGAAENWRMFKQKWMNYAVITKLDDHDRAYQVAFLLHTLGDEGLRIHNGFTYDAPDDERTIRQILDKFDAYAIGEVNETYERFLFNKRDQKPGEIFEAFMAAIRTLIKTCNYHRDSVNSILRDRIVLGISDQDTQKLLLRERNLTLEGCVNICKAAENAADQGKAMRSDNDSNNVKRVQGRPKKLSSQYQNPTQKFQKPKPEVVRECNYCGTKHAMKKELCPAWGKTCDNCGGHNHFRVRCKKPKVKLVGEESDLYEDITDEEDAYLLNVNTKRKNILTARMQVNGCYLKFQLDTGADVNTICQRFVRKEQVRPTKKNLVMWNDSKVKPLGETKLPVTNMRTGENCLVSFVVVPNNLMCLLGLETIQAMRLITVNEDRFVSDVKIVHGKLGDLGEAHLFVNSDVKPRTLPCRSVPVALKDSVKAEPENLVQLGVLVPVTEPTEWVSQMAVVRKTNGKLRICIDPQSLNEALMREHYKLPTVDDILPMLHDAKVFSKLDVKNAFWHVRLDQESSLLTTMITPFGRFRWSRLPFGLKVSSEIFQRRLNEALTGLDGMFTIADDITVAGCGSSKSEALKDNDFKLEKLYQRCDERRIILNEDKKEIGKTEIIFHGHLFTDKGVKVDISKVEAIAKMPAPTDISGVKRLCGMVQYMAKFLPNLAKDLEPIRALTRKDNEWNWSKDCEKALTTVKQKLSDAPVLAYFDSKKQLVLQVDSSKDGVGAVMLQQGKPVEYASRSLTSSERNWAQIEKELLAVTYGLERFDQYTYGRKVIVQNDHKPLAAILKKPLSQAPKRLQALLMRVHRYDVDFHFLKGTELVIADTLSRAFIDIPDARPHIMQIDFFPQISDARLEEVKNATECDPSLQLLKSEILEGWPDSKQLVPPEVRLYFDMRDMLSYHDGIILKGEAIVIPSSLRRDMKTRIHSAHLGYNSMMRRARGLIFWPGMAQDFKQLVDACAPCQELRARNQKETLKPQSDGNCPWEKVAGDFFEIEGKNYLVIIDCYSNFIEIDPMPTMTSARTIATLKRHFARYGIPRVIVTDAGSQLTSKEFRAFMKEWGIIHVESSPGHQSANGKAEAAVKVAKNLLKKAVQDGTDPAIALLEQRNTPREDTGLSPVQMLFGRKTRTMIPCFNLLKPVDSQVAMEKRRQRKETVKSNHDRGAKDLKGLSPGQTVYFEHCESKQWILGTVLSVLGERTYLVEGKTGGVYRRNRVQMRPTAVQISKPPVFVSNANHRSVAEMPNSQPNSMPNADNPSVDQNLVNTPQHTQTASDNTGITANTGTQPAVADTNAAETSAPQPRTSGRARTVPKHFQDYVMGQT